MPIKCCVPNCPSKYKREDNVRFHKFPKEINAFKLWCVKLRLCANIVKTKIIYVCSKHFQSTDYVDSFTGKSINIYLHQVVIIAFVDIVLCLRQILLQDKIPSQNLPKPSHSKAINPEAQLKREERLRNRNKAKDILMPSSSETFNQDLQLHQIVMSRLMNVCYTQKRKQNQCHPQTQHQHKLRV